MKLFDLFLTEYSSVELKFVAEILSGFFYKILTRNSFGKISRNLLHSKALLFLDLRNFAIISAILF